MPTWRKESVWEGQDACIIGGGPSLTGFDWSLLEKENTIGCNTAFTLGERVCKVCFFGDNRWWKKFQFELAKFKNPVFTNAPQLFRLKIPWLWTVPRESRGLYENAVGWNGNTGAAAINLAILFGAKRIFLLGFDMKRTPRQSNWHNKIVDQNAVKESVYPRFVKEFKWVVDDWKKKFPQVEIWNVTADSALPQAWIPWVSPDVWVEERRKIQGTLP